MATQILRNEEEEEDSEEEEEMELLKLEEELKTLSERIDDYRTTFPDQVSSSISSIFASSQRPLLPQIQSPATAPTTDSLRPAESERMPLAFTEGQEEAEKIELLKQKIASNASAIPVVLNRMKECIAKINKLDSSDPVIHPAFKRKRNS